VCHTAEMLLLEMNPLNKGWKKNPTLTVQQQF